jgi:hypothetical protein
MKRAGNYARLVAWLTLCTSTVGAVWSGDLRWVATGGVAFIAICMATYYLEPHPKASNTDPEMSNHDH